MTSKEEVLKYVSKLVSLAKQFIYYHPCEAYEHLWEKPNLDMYEEVIREVIQEYYELKTPKKLIKRMENDVVVGEYTAYDCPICKKEQMFKFKNVNKIVGFKAKYCHECGTELDWNNEDDD